MISEEGRKFLAGLLGQLTDKQIHDLIFHPGLSTAETVSDISGRGVGMDVVKRNINDLGGVIEVTSAAGQGTTFRLTLPATQVRVATPALPVLDGVDLVIPRGSFFALLGPNGAGKTTLLRLILGELQPDEGKVRQGTKVEVAYFDQFRSQLDDEMAIVDVIGDGKDFVEIGGQRRQ